LASSWRHSKSDDKFFPQGGFNDRCCIETQVDVLVCGHTHLPYQRILPSGRQVINAGSVGKPKDGDPRACYLTLSIKQGELVSNFLRVEYAVAEATAAIGDTEMPDEYADMLMAGRG
jgi:diadenosine tetraphosphatase ApaH/serine/threonine PP2A family protein phosphatase